MNLFLAHLSTPLAFPLTDVPSDSIIMGNASCLPPASQNALEVRTAETRGLVVPFPPNGGLSIKIVCDFVNMIFQAAICNVFGKKRI